tara:strand:+ start:7007 stop:8038 length:1032 start_codon:yes stop_codon:yes gene_type:complete
MSDKKTMLIGPRYNINNDSIGGIVVLFEDLISYYSFKRKKNIVIDTNMSNYRNKISGYIYVIYIYLKRIKEVDHVSLHGTSKDFLLLAPLLVFVSKIFNKETSIRKFAGSFYEVYQKSNLIEKNVYRFVLKNSNYVFFETKYLVDKFKAFNQNTHWWPNSRSLSKIKVSKTFSKRFVFISQVKRSKGIYELMSASNKFTNDYTFHVYGPILDNDFEKEIEKHPNIHYCGVLAPNEVTSTLMKYDVLVLPTYHTGEGYPGVILEAFSIGMPVISTKWNSIPEIVKDEHNGLLVPIKEVGCITNSILFFNQNNYTEFRLNALDSFDMFNSEKVNFNFIKIIESSN